MALLNCITSGFDFLTEEEEREAWAELPRANSLLAFLAEEED